MLKFPAYFSSMTFKPVCQHFKEYPVVNPKFANLALNTAMVGLNIPTM